MVKCRRLDCAVHGKRSRQYLFVVLMYVVMGYVIYWSLA
jgi:hypothetical protein